MCPAGARILPGQRIERHAGMEFRDGLEEESKAADFSSEGALAT